MWRGWKERNEMEERQRVGVRWLFYLKRRPQMCSGTGEALRTLTAPSVVAYLNSTSKSLRSRKALHRAGAPNSTPKADQAKATSEP